MISTKIGGFLKEEVFKDEFSHTIIHNWKFFDAKGNFIKPPVVVAKEEEDPK